MKFPKFEKDFLYLAVPFIVVYILLGLVGVGLLNKLFFSTAFFWNNMLIHPKLKDRAESRRYRLAFLKLVYLFDFYLQKYCNRSQNKYLTTFLQVLQPLVFATILMIAGGQGNPVYSVFGSLFFVGLNIIILKYFLIEKEIPEDSAYSEGYDI